MKNNKNNINSDNLIKEIINNGKLEFVRFDYDTKSNIFVGKLNDDDIILQIGVPTTGSIGYLNNIISNRSVITFNNDRFYKFNITRNNNFDFDNNLTVIYPASSNDIKKYGNNEEKNKKKILETFDMYFENVYPKIINQDLTWIYNILDGKTEQDNIIYQDDHFMILPDLKWIGNKNNYDINNLYCLSIVKDRNIRSIRDLTDKHISLLEHIYIKSILAIENEYHVKGDKIRAYFHYHPSYWHLHIHFNLIKNKVVGSCVDTSHSLRSVINNIKIKSDYYQAVDLEIIEF